MRMVPVEVELLLQLGAIDHSPTARFVGLYEQRLDQFKKLPKLGVVLEGLRVLVGLYVEVRKVTMHVHAGLLARFSAAVQPYHGDLSDLLTLVVLPKETQVGQLLVESFLRGRGQLQDISIVAENGENELHKTIKNDSDPPKVGGWTVPSASSCADFLDYNLFAEDASGLVGEMADARVYFLADLLHDLPLEMEDARNSRRQRVAVTLIVRLRAMLALFLEGQPPRMLDISRFAVTQCSNSRVVVYFIG